MTRIFSFIRLLWEIPLSVCSWMFFKVMKFLLGRLYTFSLSRMTDEAYDWKAFNGDMVGRPLVLPIIATKGPRWNTHAVVATAGPIDVKHSLSFEVATSFASASSWSIVIYANPGYQTVTSVESFNIAEDTQWHDLPLEPGKYSINLRYYDLRNSPSTPAVKADGGIVVAQKPVRSDNNDFYSELHERDSWFYAALHYYVFHMLRFRRWLPAAFVKREYLPVGDPGTIFRYGFIRKGERLSFSSADELIDNYDLYLTTYSRSSLPVSSEVIRDNSYRTTAATMDGFYLLRIRRKAIITAEFREDWLQINSIGPLEIPVAIAEPHQSD